MNRIKKLREEKRMTQIKLSTELEVAQETISAYESGNHYPSIPVLLKMSEIFNVSCDYILGVSDIKSILKNPETDEEIELVSDFNELSPLEKAMVKGYIQALRDKRKY